MNNTQYLSINIRSVINGYIGIITYREPGDSIKTKRKDEIVFYDVTEIAQWVQDNLTLTKE